MADTCLNIGCHDGEVLTGCAGSQSENEVYGGTKLFKNECNVQRKSAHGDLVVNAMCAKQMDTDYTLDCQAVHAHGAEMMGGDYVSTVQCPVEYTMFDCNSFMDDRIGECSGSQNLLSAEYHGSSDDSLLSGEYYYRSKKRSKYVCKAVGASDAVRAQAVCCGLF